MCRSIGAEQAGAGVEKEPWQVLAFSALSYSCVSPFRAGTEAVAAVGNAENVGNFLGWRGPRQGTEETLGWVICCGRGQTAEFGLAEERASERRCGVGDAPVGEAMECPLWSG